MNKLIVTACVALATCAGYAAYQSFSPVELDEGEAEQPVVYLCQETNKVVVAPPEAVPARNPATGRYTLYRALYCGTCAKWHALPTPDARNSNPLGYRCPQHKTPMSSEGPIPAGN
jgi:hypothetical protein